MIIKTWQNMKKAIKTTTKLKTHVKRQKTNLLQNMNIPTELNEILLRAAKVWNCDEIGLDSNGRWNKVICPYELFSGEEMWKVKTGEQAPLWCTLLVFTQSNEQCFMPPNIMHHLKE